MARERRPRLKAAHNIEPRQANQTNTRLNTMADDPSTDIDFIRFMGVRIVDAESEERGCKIIDYFRTGQPQGKTDASLLAIANKYGVIFVGTADGFQWASLADLRAVCAAGSDPLAARQTKGLPAAAAKSQSRSRSTATRRGSSSSAPTRRSRCSMSTRF